MGCLYRLTFPSGKCYVGITRNSLARRLATHRAHSRRGRVGLIYNAFRKHGEPKREIIASSDDWEALCSMEIEAIKKFNTISPNGYNISPGGVGGKITAPKEFRSPKNNSHPGWKHTDEARALIAAASRGCVFSAERRAKISAARKITGNCIWGRPVSAETRAKIGTANKGRILPTRGLPWTPARRAAEDLRKAVKNANVAS